MNTSLFARNHFQTKPCLRKENIMIKSCLFTLALLALTVGSAGAAEYPLMEAIAGKIVQKYQNSTCDQLWQEKMQKQGKPPAEMEQKAIQMLRNDPQMRSAFINKIAAPIANKMFECGMIP